MQNELRPEPRPRVVTTVLWIALLLMAVGGLCWTLRLREFEFGSAGSRARTFIRADSGYKLGGWDALYLEDKKLARFKHTMFEHPLMAIPLDRGAVAVIYRWDVTDYAFVIDGVSPARSPLPKFDQDVIPESGGIRVLTDDERRLCQRAGR